MMILLHDFRIKKKTFKTDIVLVSNSELNALGHIGKGRVLHFYTYLNNSIYCSKSTFHNLEKYCFY